MSAAARACGCPADLIVFGHQDCRYYHQGSAGWLCHECTCRLCPHNCHIPPVGGMLRGHNKRLSEILAGVIEEHSPK